MNNKKSPFYAHNKKFVSNYKCMLIGGMCVIFLEGNKLNLLVGYKMSRHEIKKVSKRQDTLVSIWNELVMCHNTAF